MTKIVIWGTGKATRKFLTYFYPELKNEYQILALADNSDKYDELFGISVVGTSSIADIDYDKIVIMPTQWEAEIFFQIKNEKLINEDKIWFKRDFYADISKRMKCHRWRVCFIGERYTYERFSYRSRFLFAEVKYSESIPVSKYDFYMICPPLYADEKTQSEYERSVSDQLVEKGIIKKKIWSYDVTRHFILTDRSFYFGNQNKDKEIYIIAPNEVLIGWGVLLRVVLAGISYARSNGMLPVVDMKNAPNQYLDRKLLGMHNSWLDFFNPVSEICIDDAYQSQQVTIGSGSIIPGMEFDIDGISLRKDIQRRIDDWKELHFPCEKVLGVIYRSTDYKKAYGHPDPIPLEKYIGIVYRKMRELDYHYIFLATETEEAVSAFQDYFGDEVFFTNQKRYHQNEERWLATVGFDRENDAYEKSVEYLEVLFLLAECDSLLSQENAAKQIAIVLNQGRYEKVMEI